MTPDRFARTMATMDTPGGHILVCLAVIFIGAAFYFFKVPKGEDLIMMASGALFMAVRGKGAENHDTDAPQQGLRIPPAPKSGTQTESTTFATTTE
jgi:hypothetical protein